MAKKSLLIANPYDNRHTELIKNYEAASLQDLGVSHALKATKDKYTESGYNDYIRTSNEVEQFLFLEEDSALISGCMLDCYKDIKSCYLTLLPSKNESTKKMMLQATTSYAIKGLGMEEVFINISSSDTRTALTVLESGFEGLGEDNGTNIYLVDKDSYLAKEGLLDGNNKKY